MRAESRAWRNRTGRAGCLLVILLAMGFAVAHFAIAWRISAWWPAVTRLPPSSPYRLIFSIYWTPPFLMLEAWRQEAGLPPGGVANLALLPMAWITCFVYGWLTALLLAALFQLRNRSRR